MLYKPKEADMRNSSQVGGGIKMTLGSSPLMNTSKLQLHIEYLSLKSTWGLAGQPRL